MDNKKLEQIEQLLETLIKLIQIKEQTRPLEIIQQRELLKQLNISPNTLKNWEQKGLKRLEPPIEGTRTVFYLLDDVINFLQS
ncbi:TPA: hypothetical protein ACT2GI_001530 [Streptococcus suis]